jgi:hypothetical protein
MAYSPLEKAPLSPASTPEAASNRVLQPIQANAVRSFLEEMSNIKEAATDLPGEDLPAAGGGSQMTAAGQQTQTTTSARQAAIAGLPKPQVMQKEITKHIQSEVKKLRKQAKRLAVTHPGSAHHLVQIYAKIHRLNSLLAEIFEAGLDVLKRLYVRIFVDRQAIL